MVILIVAAVAGVITADVPVAVGFGGLGALGVNEFAALCSRFPGIFFTVAKPVDGRTGTSVWCTFLVSID